MAKIKKKGTSGQAKNFITRTQAVKKLQISLPDFRRLCIFKGIYPREPRNKKKANKGSTAPTTFYYTKDIQYLLHEPVLAKFREHKAFAKKLARALGRHEYGDAKRLSENNAPKVTLDHIVKERYPTFIDALRDLDDALSMLFLFANLPTNHNLPSATIGTCQRLAAEWQHYVIRAHALRKSFLSIKGIYYEAEVQGQDVRWLVPYKFAQNVPADVDFRIMATFVEFYTTLLQFVLFRLYTTQGLVYPPRFDKDADAKGAGLRAFRLEARGVGALPGPDAKGAEGKQSKEMKQQLATLNDKIEALSTEQAAATASPEPQPEPAPATAEDTAIDTFQPITSTDVDVLPQPAAPADADPASLFAPFVVYLSRETPREPLEFLLRAFGCARIGWDAVLGDGAFTADEADPRITHQVVDRPPAVALPPQAEGAAAGRGRVPGRVYVQPQWVWDCVNARQLVAPAEYAPGALLPPHLSPWVVVGDGKGAYDPTAPLPVEDGAAESEEEDVEMETGMEEDLGGDESADEDAASSEAEAAADEEDEDEDEDEEEAQRLAFQKELAAEASGEKVKGESKEEARRKAAKKTARKEREEKEMKEMQKMMMPQRKRKLYEKMIYSNQKKEDEAENLRRKRRAVEKEAKKAKKVKSA